MTFVAAYAATALVFAAVDAIWLVLMMERLYRPTLGAILLPRYDFPSAVVYYFIYVLGIVVFAVHPALAEERVIEAAKNGALFGFFAFATYDLTNKSTLRNWTWKLAIIDIAWGTALTCSAATGGYLATSYFRHLFQ